MTNPDPTKMTQQECIHWLRKNWCEHGGNTLDCARRAFPEGWTWVRRGDGFWKAWPQRGTNDPRPVLIPDTGDETLDRFRLAVACRMRDKEGGK